MGKRLDFTAQIRLDKGRDQELLLAMRRAGINMVAIGYELPIEEELKAMNKQVKPQEMIAMTRLFQKAGFLVHGMFMIGFSILSFPMLVFHLYNIRIGWKRWYRLWRNTLMRFIGLFVVKKWTLASKRGPFLQKLKHARENITLR